MPAFQLNVNGRIHAVNVDGNMPLLLGPARTSWPQGTSSARRGACGACKVHLDGRARAPASPNVGVAALSKVTTIEGLSYTQPPVQKMWVELGVPQCGFCHRARS